MMLLKTVRLAGLLGIFTVLSCSSLLARELPADPLESVVWEVMARDFMPEGDIVFDGKVSVVAPLSAENQFQVPVTVDASGLNDVVEIVAVADLNPIPLVLRVRPKGVEAYLGFRLKLQQASPIHVGVRTADGVWHVGGAVVDAAGGGCTSAAAMHGNSNWMRTLGETRAYVGREDHNTARMTVRMKHPMDTGLASGIPAFYLNELVVRNAANDVLVEVELHEPVSENPTLTLKPIVGKQAERLAISTRDTEGNVTRFPLTVPALVEL